MKKLLLISVVLIIQLQKGYSRQTQYGLDKAATMPTTASPGLVFGWPQYASQNFLYNGQYLNIYGIGFHDFNDGTSIGGINSYISSYFGVDIFTAGQRRLRINTDGSTSMAGKVAIGPSQNGTSNDFEALAVYNTPSTNLPSGNGAVIQFYNNSTNTNTNGANAVYGASVKSVSVNMQYGWESDLYLRTTRNNAYSSQTILDALVVKGGSGNVGIGTIFPDAKLAVNGQVHATEVKVTIAVPGPDYVFEPTYTLPSLDSVQLYINQNKHLPEVPSAKEMETNGVNLGEMNMLLLKKVEELTLYLITQQEQLRLQQLEINNLKSKIK